jgi:hypothetical protein
MFENRVLRGIFGQERDKVKPGLRKLHNEELRNVYTSRNIIRMIKLKKMRYAGHVKRMERNGMHTGVCEKAIRKRPLGRPRRSWEDNTKTNLRGMNWNDLA